MAAPWLVGLEASLAEDAGEDSLATAIVVLAAMAGRDVHVDEDARYGATRRALLLLTAGGDPEPTTVRDNVTLRSLSVVFRSLIGDGATVGFKSGVISSEIKPGRVVPDRTIILNNATFGRVEW